MKKGFVFVTFLIAMLVVTQIPVSLVNATDVRLQPITGSDCDSRTFVYDGHTIAEGFAASISADLPLIGGRITQIKFGCAVAGLGDSWYFSSPYYYVEYTPYVKEMRVTVEGDDKYTDQEDAIVDNTGIGGSSSGLFETVMYGIDIVFMAWQIYDWLSQVYQNPPVALWEKDAHWSRAIVRQKTEPVWYPPGTWVDPDGHRLQTGCADLLPCWFEVGSSYALNVTAEADIYVQAWSLTSNYVSHIYIGTYSVSFEVSLNPVCAMKTRTDGYFYVPNVAPDLLKIEMLFDNQNVTGDQTGGTSPYGSITAFPDGKVRVDDVLFIAIKFGLDEGNEGWDYMADVIPYRKVRVDDQLAVNSNFGKSGTYITDLAGVTITFNTGQTISPDSYGCVGIPSGATSFTVKRNATPIGAMIIFW